MKKALAVVFLILASVLTSVAQDNHDKMFLTLVNEYRASNGLNPVKYDTLLDSESMVQPVWSHELGRIGHSTGVHRCLEAIDPMYTDKVKQYSVIENCYCDIHKKVKDFEVSSIIDDAILCAFIDWTNSPERSRAMLIPKTTSIGFDVRERLTNGGMGYSLVVTMIAGTKTDKVGHER